MCMCLVSHADLMAQHAPCHFPQTSSAKSKLLWSPTIKARVGRTRCRFLDPALSPVILAPSRDSSMEGTESSTSSNGHHSHHHALPSIHQLDSYRPAFPFTSSSSSSPYPPQHQQATLPPYHSDRDRERPTTSSGSQFELSDQEADGGEGAARRRKRRRQALSCTGTFLFQALLFMNHN